MQTLRDALSVRVDGLKEELAELDEEMAPLVRKRIALVEKLSKAKIYLDVKERGKQLMDEVHELLALPENTLMEKRTKYDRVNQLSRHRVMSDEFLYTHFMGFITTIRPYLEGNILMFKPEPYLEELEASITECVAKAESAAMAD